jgi:hypothetical protein
MYGVTKMKADLIAHRMQGSSQRVRQLAEKAFDVAFNHPKASRDSTCPTCGRLR